MDTIKPSKTPVMDQELTAKEERFVNAHNRLTDKFGRPPSARRLARELGYKSPNSITQFKDQLEDKNITLKKRESQ